MEYDCLSRAQFEGVVLDLGGGAKAKYRKILPADIDYRSVNIDPDIEPTYLVDPGEALPVEDESFDHCLSMNTLEHVYDAKFLLGELHRVVKKGGTVHITVPWMFKIHAHPDDFSRYSPSWWAMALGEVGFSEATIQPLLWGRQSTAASLVGQKGVLRRLRRHLAHLEDVLYAKLMFRGGDGKYSGARGRKLSCFAPGHYIIAKK